MIFTLSIVDPLFCREGKSNAHLNGDYQKIGDVMLNNMKVLQVSDVTPKSMTSSEKIRDIKTRIRAFILPERFTGS